uniref:Uncharacterized protein n=1 Tax=Molossus molossus TaxID=27622 RepID=A0A7J8JXD4_MOLMO|nr:hypothetical protein HJG59_007835 [Molossus molossus]
MTSGNRGSSTDSLMVALPAAQGPARTLASSTDSVDGDSAELLKNFEVHSLSSHHCKLPTITTRWQKRINHRAADTDLGPPVETQQKELKMKNKSLSAQLDPWLQSFASISAAFPWSHITELTGVTYGTVTCHRSSDSRDTSTKFPATFLLPVILYPVLSLEATYPILQDLCGSAGVSLVN